MNIIDKIETVLTGKMREAIPPLYITEEYRNHPLSPGAYPTANEYKIGIRWYVQGFATPADMFNVKRNIVRQLHEEIYGEFRMDLIYLERAVFDGDIQEIKSKIHALMEKVEGNIF